MRDVRVAEDVRVDEEAAEFVAHAGRLAMTERHWPSSITRSMCRPAASKAEVRPSSASSRKPLAMSAPPSFSEAARTGARRSRVRPLMLATMTSKRSVGVVEGAGARFDGDVVGGGVLGGGFDGLRVGVDGEDAVPVRLGLPHELGGGDGEDAGAAAEVEDASRRR